MRLHDNLSSGNGYKVRLLLAQLGIPFEQIEYDIDKGETRTAGFLEIWTSENSPSTRFVNKVGASSPSISPGQAHQMPNNPRPPPRRSP
jgi:hypothetical protein